MPGPRKSKAKRCTKSVAACAQREEREEREERDASLLTQSEVALGTLEVSPNTSLSGVTLEVQDTLPEQDPVPEKMTKPKTPRRVGLKLSEDKEVVVFEFVEAHPQLFDKNDPGFMKRGDKEALWKKCVEFHDVVESDGE